MTTGPTLHLGRFGRAAVITDIHGNLPALEASLEAIDALSIDECK